VSPVYADLFYTLNPKTVKELKLDFIVVGQRYKETLPLERQKDLDNERYFNIVHIFPGGEVILKPTEQYFDKGSTMVGTFDELLKIAPRQGKYYIDYPPNITENIYRLLRLLLSEREIYYNKAGSFYNSRIDVSSVYYGDYQGPYDFLVIGTSVDPKSICNCSPTLLWQGYKNGVALWQTH